MEKVNKYIYETIVKKQVEEKVIDKREENGQPVEVTRTVKKVKPVKIAILRPDRRTNKECQLFYAKRLSTYLKEGLLPQPLVAKRFLNDGGPLSEAEKALVDALRERYVTLQGEYFDMKSPLTEEQTKRRGEIILELNEIQKTLRDIQNNYSEIFANTAEAKAGSDRIEWLILNLSYANLDDKGYAPVFGTGDYEARLKTLDEIDSKDDVFLNEVVRKLSYFISFWASAEGEVTGEDLKSAEENYEQNVTLYTVEETPTETPTAPVTPTPAI